MNSSDTSRDENISSERGVKEDLMIISPSAEELNMPARRVTMQCQAQGCCADLTADGKYCIKRRICREHLKADSLVRKRYGQELLWRFCQQCGKLELLSLFDGPKRSCRIQLARRQKDPALPNKNSNKSNSSVRSQRNVQHSTAAAAVAACSNAQQQQQPEQVQQQQMDHSGVWLQLLGLLKQPPLQAFPQQQQQQTPQHSLHPLIQQQHQQPPRLLQQLHQQSRGPLQHFQQPQPHQQTGLQQQLQQSLPAQQQHRQQQLAVTAQLGSTAWDAQQQLAAAAAATSVNSLQGAPAAATTAAVAAGIGTAGALSRNSSSSSNAMLDPCLLSALLQVQSSTATSNASRPAAGATTGLAQAQLPASYLSSMASQGQRLFQQQRQQQGGTDATATATAAAAEQQTLSQLLPLFVGRGSSMASSSMTSNATASAAAGSGATTPAAAAAAAAAIDLSSVGMCKDTEDSFMKMLKQMPGTTLRGDFVDAIKVALDTAQGSQPQQQQQQGLHHDGLAPSSVVPRSSTTSQATAAAAVPKGTAIAPPEAPPATTKPGTGAQLAVDAYAAILALLAGGSNAPSTCHDIYTLH